MEKLPEARQGAASWPTGACVGACRGCGRGARGTQLTPLLQPSALGQVLRPVVLPFWQQGWPVPVHSQPEGRSEGLVGRSKSPTMEPGAAGPSTPPLLTQASQQALAPL